MANMLIFLTSYIIIMLYRIIPVGFMSADNITYTNFVSTLNLYFTYKQKKVFTNDERPSKEGADCALQALPEIN